MVGFEVDLQYSILNPEIGCFTNFTDFKRDFMHYIQITLFDEYRGYLRHTRKNLTPPCMAHRLALETNQNDCEPVWVTEWVPKIGRWVWVNTYRYIFSGMMWDEHP
jgi:hypothetical protein